MKKLILMVAFMVIASSVSFAQIGARIGMNLAGLSNTEGLKSSPGLHLGAVYNLALGESPLSLQPGFFYSQRNWKSKVGDSKAHTHHFELPILVKYNLDITSDIAIDPHVGPYFDMALGGSVKDSDPKVKIYDKKGLDYDRMDMGIQLGCGATFFEVVYVGLDYQWGFKEISQTADPNNLLKFKSIRNGNFSITFGVWLPE